MHCSAAADMPVLGRYKISAQVQAIRSDLSMAAKISNAVQCHWCMISAEVACAEVQDAKRMCREIVRVARLLASKRDMGLNELKLIVAVEDPRVKERRSMGIEVSFSS